MSMIAFVIRISACDGVGSPEGWLCTSQPRREFPLILRCMSDFRDQLGYGFGIGFSCSIGTNTRVHSESLSAIDDPIKSLIPNRRDNVR
jgi:hypothetical protein